MAAHSYLLDVTVLGDTKCFFGSPLYTSFLKVYILRLLLIWRSIMKPLARRTVSKSRSARKFRKQSSRTKAANMSINPMRGGWRL